MIARLKNQLSLFTLNRMNNLQVIYYNYTLLACSFYNLIKKLFNISFSNKVKKCIISYKNLTQSVESYN